MTSIARDRSEPSALKDFLPDLAAALMLLALCLLFFWRIITPNELDRASFPKGDFTEQFYAFAVYKAREILSGHLPLWNPYTYAGHPFLADTQAAVFYPLGLLTVFLSAPWRFPLVALESEAVLHFFLASLFTYLFARRIIRHRLGSLVAAVTFAYGGYLTAYPSQQLSILEVDIWLPLILLFIHMATESFLRPARRIMHASLAGFFLTLSVLAGHPQSYLYVIYASVAYFLFRTYFRLKDEAVPLFSRRALRALDVLFVFFAAGFGLASIQLAPSLEFASLSTRAVVGYDFTSGGFPLHDILQMILPGSVSLYSPMYVGLLPLLLAVCAVLWRKDRHIIFWAGLAVTALLVSFGGNIFLYSILHLGAPGFSTFRNWERTIFLFSFAMAILAGYGASLLTSLPKERLRCLLLFVGCAFLAAIGLFIAVSYGNAATGNFRAWLDPAAFLVILLFLITGLFYLMSKGSLPHQVSLPMVLLLIMLDLFSVNWKTNLAKPRDDYPQSPITSAMKIDSGLFRADNEYRLPLNYGAVYEVSDLRGASPLILKRYKDLSTSLTPERLYRLLNVKYLLTWEGGRSAGLEHVVGEKVMNGNKQEENHLYRLVDTLPRAYAVHQAQVISGDRQALAALASADFDPGKMVVLSEDPGMEIAGGSQALEVRVAKYAPERVEIDADMAADGVVVLSEQYYPGWKVLIDGREGKILRADYALRAVALSEGNHKVTMVFDPLSLKLGAAISGLTLVGWLAFLVGYWRLRGIARYCP